MLLFINCNFELRRLNVASIFTSSVGVEIYWYVMHCCSVSTDSSAKDLHEQEVLLTSNPFFNLLLLHNNKAVSN